MQERLDYLEIRSPGDASSIRRFIEKHKPLGIEGYERFVTEKPHVPARLNFMLGHVPEGQSKPVFVAGVTTTIFEFGDMIEQRIRSLLRV